MVRFGRPSEVFPDVVKYPSEGVIITFRTSLNMVQDMMKYPLEPTIPLKSRSPDVKVSGLIVRRKGVDMLPVSSSVKGRKVRS